jgi:hypothetical protein
MSAGVLARFLISFLDCCASTREVSGRDEKRGDAQVVETHDRTPAAIVQPKNQGLQGFTQSGPVNSAWLARILSIARSTRHDLMSVFVVIGCNSSTTPQKSMVTPRSTKRSQRPSFRFSFLQTPSFNHLQSTSWARDSQARTSSHLFQKAHYRQDVSIRPCSTRL